MPKVTKEMEIEMRKLRFEKGWSYLKIARLFGVHEDTVAYHVSEEVRNKHRERMKRCYQRHKEKINLRGKKWRKENPILFRKIMCLSLLKGYLKRGIITREEVLEVIREAER